MDTHAGKSCKVDGCTDPRRARGWCNKHYRRWQANGDPLKAAWERGDHAANFWAKTRRTTDAECWPWQGFVSDDGYGIFVWPRGRLAHRFAYELLAGAIPDGLELDHTCHSAGPCTATMQSCPHRRCVNPAHLEPVTHVENNLRISLEARQRKGLARAAQQLAKTHCPAGHEYTDENTYVDKRGSRNCRACRREKARTTDRSQYQRAYHERTRKRT